MFNLHDFVMDTLMGMVGHEPDYKVRQYALGWYDKAQLTPEDMAKLDAAIQAQYPTEVMPETDAMAADASAK